MFAPMKIGILGGGLTGLVVASDLCSQYDVEVLEKEPECGGLCRSLKERGFTFDYGGAHILFSRDVTYMDYVRSILGDNCGRGRRENKVLYKGAYVKYPFENGLSDLLSKEDIFECLYHYLKNDYPEPANFAEWMYHTFGKGITEKYLLPYNEKIWNYPPDKMSLHWVEGRIPKPPLEDVVKSAIGIPTEGYTHQLYFCYPKQGGIQSVIHGIAERIPQGAIVNHFEVRSVSREGDQWVVSNGVRERKYDILVSTIPVFELTKALDDVPAEVQSAVAGLRYSSLITVMVALKSRCVPDYTAVYVPDKGFRPNRIAFPHVFSSGNCPPGKSSVVAEITANKGDGTWELSDEDISQHVIDGLTAKGLVAPATVEFVRVRRSKYAYVVYDLAYLENVRRVREYVTSLGVRLCGRFAEFEYLNMDACADRARSLASELNRTRNCTGPLHEAQYT
jgi:protoporphyrinogen oxidase